MNRKEIARMEADAKAAWNEKQATGSQTHEHSWCWNGGHWICSYCQEEAASEDPQIEPCLICGAECDADVAYCDSCSDNMYRGVPRV